MFFILFECLCSTFELSFDSGLVDRSNAVLNHLRLHGVKDI